MKVVEFLGGTDVIVIDQNDEMSDFANPRGYIYGFLGYVQAISERGDTRIMYLSSARWERDVLAEAEAQAAALNARLAAGKLPVAFDTWQAGRALYGSAAYVDYGQQEELEWEARMAEEEAWS
jgi:hypothetical protein